MVFSAKDACRHHCEERSDDVLHSFISVRASTGQTGSKSSINELFQSFTTLPFRASAGLGKPGHCV